jgi:superfamily II DNA/RNA helicase
VVVSLDEEFRKGDIESDNIEERGERGSQIRATVSEKGALPRCIILAPTRELTAQTHLELRRLTYGSNTKSISIYGGNDVKAQLAELSSGCDIIVATPGRLNDLVDRAVVSLSQVSCLVLDEADRMLDMGFEVLLFYFSILFLYDLCILCQIAPD